MGSVCQASCADVSSHGNEYRGVTSTQYSPFPETGQCVQTWSSNDDEVESPYDDCSRHREYLVSESQILALTNSLIRGSVYRSRKIGPWYNYRFWKRLTMSSNLLHQVESYLDLACRG